MAKRERTDRGLKSRLDDLELRIQQMKILYEKYFSGLEKLEPVRERESLRRKVRELNRQPFRSTAQRYRFQTLKARFSSIDQYINRNMVLVERGIHPRFRFRAELAGRGSDSAPQRTLLSPVAVLEARRRREEEAYRKVYEKYMSARRSCGQPTGLPFEKLRGILVKQVRTLKKRHQCDSVKFRIVVAEGKARLKAIPMIAVKRSDEGSDS